MAPPAMASLILVTHPEVTVDPAVPVPDWGLSDVGRARMVDFAAGPVAQGARAIWASPEAKAAQAAAILAQARNLPVQTDPDLVENDRSATGFLPPPDFERAADAFFARPADSYRGWETARDAQARILRATRRIVARQGPSDLVIVAHGAVGTLLYCALAGLPIDRRHDQPFQGHYWTAPLPGLEPAHGWRPIAPRP